MQLRSTSAAVCTVPGVHSSLTRSFSAQLHLRRCSETETAWKAREIDGRCKPTSQMNETSSAIRKQHERRAIHLTLLSKSREHLHLMHCTHAVFQKASDGVLIDISSKRSVQNLAMLKSDIETLREILNGERQTFFQICIVGEAAPCSYL